MLSDLLSANNGSNFLLRMMRSMLNGDNLSDRYYAIVVNEPISSTLFDFEPAEEAKQNVLYDITARTLKPFNGETSRQFSEFTGNPCVNINDPEKQKMLAGLQTKFVGVLPDNGLKKDDIVIVQFKYHTVRNEKRYNLERGILLEKVNSNSIGVQRTMATTLDICEEIAASNMWNGGTPTSVGSGSPLRQVAPVIGGPSTKADILSAYPKSAPIVDEIIALSKKLGVPDPGWLANLINFETGMTFDPSTVNHIGATGLIQFIPSTAKSLGTTTEALAKMTPKEQMVYVEKYLLPYSGKMNNPTDLYMAVFFPTAVGKGGNFSIYEWYRANESQTKANTFARQNPGILTAQDYTNFANGNAKLPTQLPSPGGNS